MKESHKQMMHDGNDHVKRTRSLTVQCVVMMSNYTRVEHVAGWCESCEGGLIMTHLSLIHQCQHVCMCVFVMAHVRGHVHLPASACSFILITTYPLPVWIDALFLLSLPEAVCCL